MAGRYVVLDEIASGGMARVHLARLFGGAGFDKVVAVKRLPPELSHDASRAEALVAEARHVSRIRHPNVVSVIDVLEDERGVGIVMELVHGVALTRLMHAARLAGRRISPAVAVAVVVGVLRGLHAAHLAKDERGEAMGLVHRDVSPQNVLLGADGVARVVDFGIAKAVLAGDPTRGAELKGKPAYMAPEQLRGDPVDARTDVYAACVIAWELVTGQRLFAAEGDYAIAQKVLHRPVDSPSRIVREVPPELSQVILRGVSRDPAERFSSALTAAEAFEAAVAPASPSEVARLLSELCQKDLDELHDRVVRAESHEAQASERRPRRAPLLLLAAAGAVAAASWWALARGEASAPLASFPALPAMTIQAKLPEKPAAIPAATTSASAPRVHKPPLPPRTSAAPTASAPAPAAPDCEPPYVVDESGFHRMKPECLGR